MAVESRVTLTQSQAVKEKLEDMKEMRKVKAEAKAEEKAEKDIAKVRVDIAHELRLAKEAEASMDMHVTKVGRKVEHELEKHGVAQPNLSSNVVGNPNRSAPNTLGHSPNLNCAGAPPPTTKFM